MKKLTLNEELRKAEKCAAGTLIFTFLGFILLGVGIGVMLDIGRVTIGGGILAGLGVASLVLAEVFFKEAIRLRFH